MRYVRDPWAKRSLRRVIRRLAETTVGWKLIEAAVIPELGEQRFDAVDVWPAEVRGFHDLAFLFTATSLNYGLVSQNIDEAAYLYGVASSVAPSATAVEIGRFKGGSTFLLAAALPPTATLYSYDLHLELPPGLTGEAIDLMLEQALGRYRLDAKVRLLVADSRAVAVPEDGVDFLFVDGDHSYEGVRADVEHWFGAMRPGGHMLFHDAAPFSGYPLGRSFPGVRRLVEELKCREGVAYEGAAGSLVHFRLAS